MVFPACAFAVIHAAGCGVIYMSPLDIAAFASAGAVLSGVMFGAYWDACGMPIRGRLTDTTVPVSVIVTTAFAHNALSVADNWGPCDIEVALQSFAAIAMAGTAMAVAVFGAEYSKNRERNPRRFWKAFALLFTALIGLGAFAYCTPSGAGGPCPKSGDL